MTVAEADAALTGPGGFFEIVTETVGGIEMGVVASPHRSLRDLLAASVNHGGDGSARYYLFDDGRRATFAENIDHAAAVAAGLAERYGVGPGDRVGLLGANQPGWIQGFWGTVSAGAIAVAMNGWWKGDEIRYGLELTEPKVLIADRRRLARLDGDPGIPVIPMDPGPDAARPLNDNAEDSGDGPATIHGPTGTAGDSSSDATASTGTLRGLSTVDGLVDAYRGASLPDCEIGIDDPAAILFTSGTTGRPRGAVQTHRNFFAYLSCAFMIGARQFLRFPGQSMDAGGPTLACSPLFHVSGLHACAVTAVGAGVNHLWTTGRYDAEKILRLTEEHGIARWGGVTTQLWRLVEHPRLRDYDTSSVVSIGGGGSVWSPELQEICRTALPQARVSVTIGYGLTESSGLASSAADDVLRAYPDSVGYPLPTVEVRITDDEGRELPDGAVGNICLFGPVVMPGYWNDPEATADTIRDGWLRTGDYGYLRDGLLFLVSRRSDLIIRGGENIYPTEIEQRLDAHSAVAESAVFGVDHRELGQEVKAIVVLDSPPANTDTTPTDATPAHTTATDTTPTDATTADTAEARSPEADATPAHTTATDTSPTDATPADTAATDTSPTDATPADTAATDASPTDATPADTAEARSPEADATSDDGDATELIAELKAWVAEALADIKVPAHWELRTEPLPRNATGKILKRVLQGEADYDFVEE